MEIIRDVISCFRDYSCEWCVSENMHKCLLLVTARACMNSHTLTKQKSAKAGTMAYNSEVKGHGDLILWLQRDIDPNDILAQ